MDTRELADSIALFAGLDDDAIRRIIDMGYVWVLPPDTLVVSEGEPGEALYVILAGAVKRFSSARGGREAIFGVETTGAWFGEVALIDGAVRGTSVMTTARTRLLVIPRDGFRACIDRHPQFAACIIHGLAHKIRNLTGCVRSMAGGDVRGRVICTLRRFADPAQDGWVVAEGLTQQLIADMVGASRERTGRVLRALIAEGVIVLEGGRMRIVDERG